MIFGQNKNPASIQLISLHIQKTGGSSLLKTLCQTYGHDHVYWYRRRNYQGHNSNTSLEKVVPAGSKVLHGHFHYSQVKKLHRKGNAFLITFLRNPVERIVSRYYFTKKELSENPGHPKQNQRHDSLLEFAARERNINKMSKYLDGIPLEKIDFIGFTEDFDQDIRLLGQKLGWKKVPLFHEKDNRDFYQRYPVSDEERQQIASWNEADIKLYNQARGIRSKLKVKG